MNPQRHFSRGSRLNAATPREEWPEVMTAQEVATVLRRGHKTVLRAVQKGTMAPLPVLDRHFIPVKPLRWNKRAVVDYLGGPVGRAFSKAS